MALFGPTRIYPGKFAKAIVQLLPEIKQNPAELEGLDLDVSWVHLCFPQVFHHRPIMKAVALFLFGGRSPIYELAVKVRF